MSFIIIIPTYNAVSAGIERLLQSIKEQSVEPEKICIIDSSSTDNTVEICRNTAMFIGMVIFTGLNYLSQRFIVFR